MSTTSTDCKRIPYGPSVDEKFHISEITGTKTDKNEIRYYKVRWEHSWIPASRLRAWQDLIIQFWEGYHSNNDQKVMELDSPCDQAPQVYVLTSDSESRDELQVVASTNSEKRNLETEQDISSSVNFDTYVEEDTSDTDRPEDMYLDNDKVSILGHKRLKIIKQRTPRTTILPTPPPLDNALDHQPRSEGDQTEQQYLAERERLVKQDRMPGLERERIKEEPYSPFQRTVENVAHVPPDHRSFISLEKNAANSGEMYNSPNYRMSISPNSTREPHELQVVSTYSVRRNSVSPHDPQSMFDNVPQKKAFYCYLCGKEYRSGTGLKQHLLAHKNEKPFGCSICHRRYRWKGDLNRHMYTHLPNNELPLKCPECHKGFVRKDKMQLHINFAHGGGANDDMKPKQSGHIVNDNNNENNQCVEPQPLPLPPPPP